jgi:hypothetical protein
MKRDIFKAKQIADLIEQYADKYGIAPATLASLYLTTYRPSAEEVEVSEYVVKLMGEEGLIKMETHPLTGESLFQLTSRGHDFIANYEPLKAG